MAPLVFIWQLKKTARLVDNHENQERTAALSSLEQTDLSENVRGKNAHPRGEKGWASASVLPTSSNAHHT